MNARRNWQGMNQFQLGFTGGSALRIGDAEREDAAQALGEHFATGRLDRAEYDDRLAAAFAARTEGDLLVLFTDLPLPHPGRPAVRVGSGPRFSGLPFLPLLMVLIGLAMLFEEGWPLWVGLGVYLLVRRRRPAHRWSHGCGHSSGSRRPPAGSWA